MKNTVIEEPGQVILGPDLETRQFIASGYDLDGVEARTRLLRSALDLYQCLHWAGPKSLVVYLLEASGAEAGLTCYEFERIVEAADRYAERNSVLPSGVPAELSSLIYGRAVTV